MLSLPKPCWEFGMGPIVVLGSPRWQRQERVEGRAMDGRIRVRIRILLVDVASRSGQRNWGAGHSIGIGASRPRYSAIPTLNPSAARVSQYPHRLFSHCVYLL